jgi:hypothetical protein
MGNVFIVVTKKLKINMGKKIKVRFNLGRGENYMKWRIEDTDTKNVSFFEPTNFRATIYDGKLYNQKSAAIYTSGGGLKAHLGFEKPLGKKLKIFGEYAASYVVTSPYFLIEQPTYSTDAEKKVWWYTAFHQFGIGFRF